MIQMKEKIIEVLREHPGLRKREIASYLHCHHFKILGAMTELKNDGLIKSICIRDLIGDGSIYDKWYLAEDVLDNGASAINPDDL